MNTDVEQIYLEAVHIMLTFHRALRRYSKKLHGKNMSGRQIALLRLLLEPGPHTIGAIAKYLFISESSVSELATKMGKAGLISRSRSAHDQRIVEVTATDEGKRFAREVPLGGMPLLRERMKSLPQSQLRGIRESLSTLLKLLEMEDV